MRDRCASSLWLVAHEHIAILECSLRRALETQSVLHPLEHRSSLAEHDRHDHELVRVDQPRLSELRDDARCRGNATHHFVRLSPEHEHAAALRISGDEVVQLRVVRVGTVGLAQISVRAGEIAVRTDGIEHAQRRHVLSCRFDVAAWYARYFSPTAANRRMSATGG